MNIHRQEEMNVLTAELQSHQEVFPIITSVSELQASRICLTQPRFPAVVSSTSYSGAVPPVTSTYQFCQNIDCQKHAITKVNVAVAFAVRINGEVW